MQNQYYELNNLFDNQFVNHLCLMLLLTLDKFLLLDNYTFTMHKFLMDALVEGEVIEDDLTCAFCGFKEDCYGSLEARPIPSGKITNYFVDNKGASF